MNLSFKYLATLLIFFSCSKKENKVSDFPAQQKPDVPSQTDKKPEDSLRKLNEDILTVLKNKNYEKLSEFIHPEKGIRFSMYATVDTLKDKHFTKTEFAKYALSPVKFTWGEKDGTGELLIMPLSEYLEKWVFSKDFTVSKYTANQFLGAGNSVNNLKIIYPKAVFTENYLPGTEKYSGMDWNSLRLVFEKFEGKYFLVAIINDRWTI